MLHLVTRVRQLDAAWHCGLTSRTVATDVSRLADTFKAALEPAMELGVRLRKAAVAAARQQQQTAGGVPLGGRLSAGVHGSPAWLNTQAWEALPCCHQLLPMLP